MDVIEQYMKSVPNAAKKEINPGTLPWQPGAAEKYVMRNYPDMIDENGKFSWAGKITLKDAQGNKHPPQWMEYNSGCYYVQFFWDGLRMGRVVGFTKKRSGIIMVRIKTPEHFDMTRQQGKTGYSMEIPFENILFALDYRKRERKKKR